MIGYLTEADGSPCPTIVIDARDLPGDHDALVRVLERTRRHLVDAGHAHVLKLALIAPAADPRFDLDYRFVQVLPGKPDRLDFGGNCGHSILCSIVAARHLHLLPRLAPGTKVRVRVVNNGDSVVCAVQKTAWPTADFTVHFMAAATARLGDALPTGEPISQISFGHKRVPISFVSAGNPYVFVDAATLGISDGRGLFSDDPELFRRVVALRAAAIDHLGLPLASAFPKLAVLGQFAPDQLTVRALTVPSWHPTLALTGTVCLGVATAIEHSIPYNLAQLAGATPGEVTVDTPGNTTSVRAAVTGTAPDDRLLWTSVDSKRARFVKRLTLDPASGLRPACPDASRVDGRRRARSRRAPPLPRSHRAEMSLNTQPARGNGHVI